jgi:hypothetical protein
MRIAPASLAILQSGPTQPQFGIMGELELPGNGEFAENQYPHSQ